MRILAGGDGAGLEQELVGEGALAVVDVGDDGEVADLTGRRHGRVRLSDVTARSGPASNSLSIAARAE